MIKSFVFGHECYYDEDSCEWRYLDNDNPTGKRRCKKCGEYPTKDGHDSCLGDLGKVISACCGHGKEGFVKFDSGVTITGTFTSEDHTDSIFKYNVLDIAKYIIQRETNLKRNPSNLRLQKLLYFVQCGFIAYYDKKCFEEDMEVWQFGAVVPDVYSKYREYGALPISLDRTYSLNEFQISLTDQDRIDHILDEASNFNTNYLTDICKSQFKPNGVHYKILFEDIKSCFGKNEVNHGRD